MKTALLYLWYFVKGILKFIGFTPVALFTMIVDLGSPKRDALYRIVSWYSEL